MGSIAPPRPVIRREFERRQLAAMDPCYQPRKKAFAEIDPDFDSWFHGVLIFYIAIAFCVFIGGLGFLFFFLLSHFV